MYDLVVRTTVSTHSLVGRACGATRRLLHVRNANPNRRACDAAHTTFRCNFTYIQQNSSGSRRAYCDTRHLTLFTVHLFRPVHRSQVEVSAPRMSPFVL